MIKNIIVKFLIALTPLLFFIVTPTVLLAEADSSGGGGFVSGVADSDGQRLIDWINNIMTTLAAISMLAITGAIIYAGIQYSIAGGNPQAAAAAKKRIGQAITALIALFFMYGFIQWLVPGGVF